MKYRHKTKYSKNLSPYAPVKALDLMFSPKWRYSSCGLPIGPLSGNPGAESFFATIGRTTPIGCQSYMAEPAQMYIHWLYALYDSEINAINGSFAGSTIAAFEFLNENWQSLVNDIRHETVSDQHHIPSAVANLINLEPDPKRADELEVQFNLGMKSIVSRIWKNMRKFL